MKQCLYTHYCAHAYEDNESECQKNPFECQYFHVYSDINLREIAQDSSQGELIHILGGLNE